VSSYARYSDNRGQEIDDASVGLSAGPEWRLRTSKIALRVTGEQRWFSGAPYSESFGGRADWSGSDSESTLLEVSALAVYSDENQADLRDGPLLGVDLTRTHFLGPDSFWRVSVSARRADAEMDAESYWLGRIAPAYYRALPHGLALYVEPSLLLRRNDEMAFGFSKVREDVEASVGGRIFRTDLSAWGFSPYVGAQYSDNRSSVALYSFNRTRYEIGVSRSF
jgi:hypothetical protein